MAECHADSAVQLPLSSALYGQGNSDSHKGVHPFSHFFFFMQKKISTRHCVRKKIKQQRKQRLAMEARAVDRNAAAS